MTTRKPPRLATALMQRFAENDPLAGDLHEEYHSGRSGLWYWRQVLATVFARWRTVDVYELLAARSLFMQCVMLGLISVCVVFSAKMIVLVLLDETLVQEIVGPHVFRELVRLSVSFAVALPVGVAVAHLHARSRAAAILVFSVVVPLWAFGNLYVLDGTGNLDAALPHAAALLIFIVGLLTGGLHTQLPAGHGNDDEKRFLAFGRRLG